MNTKMAQNENATRVAEIKKELTSIYNKIKDMREKDFGVENYSNSISICNNVGLQFYCNDCLYDEDLENTSIYLHIGDDRRRYMRERDIYDINDSDIDSDVLDLPHLEDLMEWDDEYIDEFIKKLIALEDITDNFYDKMEDLSYQLDNLYEGEKKEQIKEEMSNEGNKVLDELKKIDKWIYNY